ncbi:hypothetical protein PUN28_004603 [Cardiocondyla obscurior]|uniref:Uncharacterized protein n=1 Tax=Cardiocondyla obscurior TaxID=286306 RepID=A0AAW2GEF5_9HYME
MGTRITEPAGIQRNTRVPEYRRRDSVSRFFFFFFFFFVAPPIDISGWNNCDAKLKLPNRINTRGTCAG